MSKEWILNATTGRFQLNFKRNAGAVAEEIGQCEPKTLDEWQQYYFSRVHSAEHLEELGRKLYIKITEVVRAEAESITEEDCINYIRNLVIKRTCDGYITEKTTVYEQLQELLGVPIEPAPDEWDRLFNVDFFIRAGDNFIGLQIKPATFYNASEYYKWRDVQKATHQKFQARFGGAIFTVVSVRQGDKKVIANPKVIAEMQTEIRRLSASG